MVYYCLQIEIQASVGGGIHNDIAIDDLSLTPGCQVGGMSTNYMYYNLMNATCSNCCFFL